MNCRPHGGKPTVALWMLVALADVGIIATAAGPALVLLIIAGLLIAAGGVYAARSLGRRAPAPAKAEFRRRA
ncbi:hypothetical protein [Actinoplanes regularis]|uniref:Uncharacterized protein n=1 Tax=Actinoplanes regularis TaxID=52697 RepID=A0A238VA06_9ACTN|nr:hypothetical protein [Actinoplanes regularis]GIE83692.1 hypothetical protein Are01nite_01720 [Actinoplanes regularis]SNR31021.1 hypothetical protein SAMN06264365_101900 [Actinoplanes regularis]